MSVVIRLKKTGSKNQSKYRVVVAEKRSKRNGRSLAEIGFYNPMIKPPEFKIDQAEVKKWLANGAQLSGTVKKLLDQTNEPKK